MFGDLLLRVMPINLIRVVSRVSQLKRQMYMRTKNVSHVHMSKICFVMSINLILIAS